MFFHIFTFYLYDALHVFESWNAYIFYYFYALLRQSLNLLGKCLTNIQHETNFTAPAKDVFGKGTLDQHNIPALLFFLSLNTIGANTCIPLLAYVGLIKYISSLIASIFIMYVFMLSVLCNNSV